MSIHELYLYWLHNISDLRTYTHTNRHNDTKTDENRQSDWVVLCVSARSLYVPGVYASHHHLRQGVREGGGCEGERERDIPLR